MNRRVNRFVGVALVAMTLVGVSACLDSPDIEDPNVQLQKDITTIDNYLNAKGIMPSIKDPSGIRVVIQHLGNKLPARTTSTVVSVDYKGFTIPAEVAFDQGNVSGLALREYVQGWQLMLLKLPVGTKADLYLPSYWAYGKDGKGDKIGPNTPLLFRDFEIRSAVLTSAEQTQFTKDTTAISAYFEQKSITDAVYDTTGIRYKITTQGAGMPISWFSKVSFKASYKLLTDDTKAVAEATLAPVEGSDSRPIDYIQGLMIGLQKLREGSKARFYIPSGLAFGVVGAPPSGTKIIPADANIIVDVEVSDVQ